VKFLLVPTGASRARFARKGRTLALVRHPNVLLDRSGTPRICDFGLARTGAEAAPPAPAVNPRLHQMDETWSARTRMTV
jgi:serine/threonine protein kinase